MSQIIYFALRNEFKMVHVNGVRKTIKHAYIAFDYIILS